MIVRVIDVNDHAPIISMSTLGAQHSSVLTTARSAAPADRRHAADSAAAVRACVRACTDNSLCCCCCCCCFCGLPHNPCCHVDDIRRQSCADIDTQRSSKMATVYHLEDIGSPCSDTELIPVFGSQPAGNVSHKPGGRLPLLSARPVVTLATLKKADTGFVAW